MCKFFLNLSLQFFLNVFLGVYLNLFFVEVLQVVRDLSIPIEADHLLFDIYTNQYSEY